MWPFYSSILHEIGVECICCKTVVLSKFHSRDTVSKVNEPLTETESLSEKLVIFNFFDHDKIHRNL